MVRVSLRLIILPLGWDFQLKGDKGQHVPLKFLIFLSQYLQFWVNLLRFFWENILKIVETLPTAPQIWVFHKILQTFLTCLPYSNSVGQLEKVLTRTRFSSKILSRKGMKQQQVLTPTPEWDINRYFDKD